ncbi:hypothetical protein SK128_003998, partial [Halocaridina rubra]
DNVTAAEVVTTIAASLRHSRRDVTLAPGDLITITEILDRLHAKHKQDLKSMTLGIAKWKIAMVSRWPIGQLKSCITTDYITSRKVKVFRRNI